MITEKYRVTLAAVCKADDAWQAELDRLFGKESCNARYQDRGHGQPGTKLRELHDARRDAWEIWDEARIEGHKLDMAAWRAHQLKN